MEYQIYKISQYSDNYERFVVFFNYERDAKHDKLNVHHLPK